MDRHSDGERLDPAGVAASAALEVEHGSAEHDAVREVVDVDVDKPPCVAYA